MVLLKNSKAKIQMLQPLRSSGHNINYCTMLTKWATVIPDQNQTYNKILSSTDKQEDNSFWCTWCHQENNSIKFAISKLDVTAETALAVSASVSGNAHRLLTLQTVQCVFQRRERLMLSAEHNNHTQHSWHRTSQPSKGQHYTVFIRF